MKLELIGHNYQYAAEQILVVLFPGEKPVFAKRGPGEDGARIALSAGKTWVTATTHLRTAGKCAQGCARVRRTELEKDELSRDSLGQKIVKQSFFRAATAITGARPPWGALTGIRPARLVTKMLDRKSVV